MAKADYYELLGVERSATDAEIKTAYRKLAKELHPDRNPDDPTAEERFKLVSEAYSVLIDSNKRRVYDRGGHEAFSNAGPTIDPRAVGEILEGLFGELFGTGRSRVRQGNDVEEDVPVSFEDAALGTTKSVAVSRWVTCNVCNGDGAAPGTHVVACTVCAGRGDVITQRGFFSLSRTCSACQGLGKKPETPCPSCKGKGGVRETVHLDVKIPGGTTHGTIRSLKGQGDRSWNGGAPGDLHLKIVVSPHPFFTRDGADVRVTVPISFPTAVLGGQLEAPTLEGKVTLKVSPGTPSGRVLRVRGKGAVQPGQDTERGDLLVTTHVEIPERVSKKQRLLLEQLANEFGEEPPPEERGFLDKLKGFFG